VAIGAQVSSYNSAWDDKPRDWEVGTFTPWPHDGDDGVYDFEALAKRWAEKGCLHINARTNPAAIALAATLDRSHLVECLRRCFDAQQYFDRAPKRIAIDAMIECCGRNRCISSKKADIALSAIDTVLFTGWLPPVLRVGVEDVYRLNPWLEFAERQKLKREAAAADVVQPSPVDIKKMVREAQEYRPPNHEAETLKETPAPTAEKKPRRKKEVA
jgi:hypothetical protein